MKRLAAAIIMAAGWATRLGGQQLSPTESKRVDSVFAQFDGTTRPGCAVGIARSGTPVYLRGFGMADLQSGLAITPESIFHVASVSKQFTAIAVAMLAEDGRLSLDDEVRKHLPELPDYGKKITIRHLIHHTSGIRDQWELLGLAGWRYPDDLFTQGDVLDIVARQRALNFNPGDEYLYSNSGYTLLAVILERVSGKTLRAFTEERIFGPLGMTRTHFHDNHRMIVPGRTAAYQGTPGHWELSVPAFDTHGATSLFTTVGDLLKWQHNFEALTVGPRKLLSEAETSAMLNTGRPANYGFGISVDTFRGTPALGHGGADAGYRADIVRFPAHGLAVAVACNFAGATPGAYSRAVAGVLLDARLNPVQPPPQPSAVEPERLRQLAGVYKSPHTDQAFRFLVDDGKLTLQNLGLRFESVDSFRFRVGATEAVFYGPPGQVPSGFRLTQGRTVLDSNQRMPAFAPDRGRLAEYEGEYWSDELRVSYRVEFRDSSLVLHRFKHGATPMQPAYFDAFLVRGTGLVVKFLRPRGRVAGLQVTGGRVRNVAFVKGNRP